MPPTRFAARRARSACDLNPSDPDQASAHRPHRHRRERQSPGHPGRHPHAERSCERLRCPPDDDEAKILARFPGFGPVALSIFPDPVTGKFKDAAGRPSARN